ncbi:MAG TPA: adenosylcobinamide-GDP ribazoletransferase [Puia sp.]|jgi:adenosylcobinamide-GDP ribazoletransferase|nr:adenosylcobinamide-GDP ribazoletransferase [Puia sp.]
MKKEIRVFFTAVMFLTRLPVPRATDHSADYLRQAPRYFPVVGWIVGGLCSLAFWVFSRYVSIDIGILASMIAGFLATGCFHEDGFADVCDGMGGGWTKEKILSIMKDSRIGAYGAIGLITILAAKFLLLKELPVFIPAVVAAHSVSRLMPVFVMKTGTYAADPDQSKARPLAGPSVSGAGLAVAIVLALLPFILLPWYFTVFPWYFAVVIIPALAVTYGMYRWFFKWIGGYTGDCLGSIQQVTEITVYLGCILLWRYL